jgi:hypothetical protein
MRGRRQADDDPGDDPKRNISGPPYAIHRSAWKGRAANFVLTEF